MSLVVPSSGALTMSTLASVYGLSPPYKLSDLRKGGLYVPNIPDNSNVKSTISNMNMSDYRNSTVEYKLTVVNNSTNYNLYNSFVELYTNFAVLKKYVGLTINSGITIGATSSVSPALDIGQFPSGTTISVVNNGNIYGVGGTNGSGGTVYGAAVGAAGGATNGGSGGDAIKADYLNQTVTITNNGVVYAGGGGGGGGGKADDYYINAPYSSYTDGRNVWRVSRTNQSYLKRISVTVSWATNISLGYWSSIYNIQISNPTAEQVTTYENLSSVTTTGSPAVSSGTAAAPPVGTLVRKGAFLRYNGYTNETNYTAHYNFSYYAGAGGTGGSGSSGRGFNYNGSLTGLAGGSGTNGASSGGSGGNGGDWGQSGSAGGGTNPGAGGTAGRYLLKGSATVTLTGGTIAGLLA